MLAEAKTKQMGLFDDFDGVSHQQWKDKIIADLKGKDYNDNLIWQTEEGFKIEPIYNSDTIKNNTSKTYNLFSNQQTWEIREQIEVANIKEANSKALIALKGGANSIQFNGEIQSQNDFNLLLNDIMIDIITIHFYTPTPEDTQLFLNEHLTIKQLSLSKINCTISFDGLGEYLVSGNKNFIADINTSCNLSINGFNYTNAGASTSQEIAYSLSQAVAYINKLTQLGLSANEAIDKLIFKLGISSNYFMEIAKVRAFKILWKLISSEYHYETTPYIHSQTTTYNITAADAQTNILRTTTEAMSAIIGGSNSLSITPFNNSYENPSEFTTRIARNIQILLKEEAYLDKVSEAAKGAYYIEELTDNLVNSALTLFKKIEANGGFLNNIENANIQNSIKETHSNRLSAYINNTKTLLGINKHPNKMETAPETTITVSDSTPPITPLLPINLAKEILTQQATINV